MAYDHVTTALRVYMRHHPTPNRMPGLAVWLHFQAFAEILTDYAFTSTSPVNIHACLDGISLLVNIAQMLVRIDYRLPFHPRRLRDLPNRVVNLISTVVGQLRKAPPDAVQTALRQGRMSSLLPQLEELVQCRGQHGPLLFPRLWLDVDELRDMRDRRRANARKACEAVYDVLRL